MSRSEVSLDLIVTDHLAEQLAAMRPELDRRAVPYLDAATLRVDKAELLRRARIATAYLADEVDCRCQPHLHLSLAECPRHYLEAVLAGDL